MTAKIKSIIKVLSVSLAAVYPVLVFYFLVIQKTPLRLISLFVMGFALFAFIAATSKKKVNQKPLFCPPCYCLAQA